MKFLIQQINGKIIHDFSFTLLKSIEYQNWLQQDNSFIKYKFLNTKWDGEKFDEVIFKPFHKKYVPVGSVEFVTQFLQYFYNKTPEPLNVPEELFKYTYRGIYNGTEKSLPIFKNAFVKSNDKIKGYCNIVECNAQIPVGNYQISELIKINSEWRAFIYNQKLVGIQNYSGDFEIFPDIDILKLMILKYESAPIAYTLDIGINEEHTFVVEAHDFFSCGLYGFSNHRIYPQMLNQWFRNYIKK
jgi:hypothetical protein